jgi:carboxymethylenebutenolidase
MIESHVNVTTKYGQQPCFAVCPDAPGQFPAIIVYMDAPGTREELRDHARRIAKHGYFCLLPDLYYRLGSVRFDIPRRNEAMSAVIRACMQSLTIAGVMDDTGGMFSWLDAQEQVKPGPAGCVGHCMSGPFALAAASRYPRMMAAAALYGVAMVTDAADSPHVGLEKIKGEVYVGFAETDPAVPGDIPPKLKSALEKAGTRHVQETIPGTHHGFLFAARADYNHVASEATWDKLFDLWDRNLK